MQDTRKVLIADDNTNLIAALRRRLRRRFNLLVVHSGTEGLDMLQQEAGIAVVVSDLHMGEMDGITFLNAVKAFDPFITRMVLTGNIEQAMQAEVEKTAGVTRYLTKPCDADVLVDAIQDGLDAHATTARLTAGRPRSRRTPPAAQKPE